MTMMRWLLLLTLFACGNCLEIYAENDDEQGYLTAELNHYNALNEISESEKPYLMRMLSPLQYLAQLKGANRIDKEVASVVSRSTRVAVLSQLNPHMADSYNIDIFYQVASYSTNSCICQSFKIPMNNNQISISGKSEIPSWMVEAFWTKIKLNAGVFIPEKGEDKVSYFLTIYENGRIYRVGSLCAAMPQDLAGRIGMASIILYGLEQQNPSPLSSFPNQ